MALTALGAAALWSYWPTLTAMVAAWGRDPDYSHGYFVAPLAAAFLWWRRADLDRSRLGPGPLGLVLLGVCLAARVAAGAFYLGPLDAWTLPITVAGIVWLVFGPHCLLWSLPSIAFLYFMIPIPYSAETWLSVPLQGAATLLSTESLQLLGLPAIAEGNVILVDNQRLEVAQACSGLRILVGIFALAFAYVLFTRWAWWQKGFVVLAAIPVALLANTLRIVATGLLLRVASSETAKTFTHDLSGFVMIPLAAGLFWLLLVFLDALFPKVQTLSPAAVLTAAGEQG